jgi:hypothetical protein
MDRLDGSGEAIVVESKHGRVPVAGGIVGHHWNPPFGVFDSSRGCKCCGTEEFQSLENRGTVVTRAPAADRFVYQGAGNVVESITGGSLTWPKQWLARSRRLRPTLRKQYATNSSIAHCNPSIQKLWVRTGSCWSPNRSLRIETVSSNKRFIICHPPPLSPHAPRKPGLIT